MHALNNHFIKLTKEMAVLSGQTRCHRVAKLGATGFAQATLSKSITPLIKLH
jgi:hypothetical protein